MRSRHHLTTFRMRFQYIANLPNRKQYSAPKENHLLQKGTNLPEGRRKLICAICRRILELLEQTVDRRAHFSSIGGLCVATIRDIQRIEGHGSLLSSTFVG